MRHLLHFTGRPIPRLGAGWPWVLILLMGFSPALLAAELKVGDTLPALAAKDQFGKDFTTHPGLHYLILAFEMDASKQAITQLNELGTPWLDQQHAAYVVDLHRMPSFARLFALPKMQKYPTRMVLCEDEKPLLPYPRKPAMLTILKLTDDQKISAIQYWNPATEKVADLLK